ncbi:MAG: methyltransferase [Armatimonadetes bacterium]|nr:methyltransferase [Armatimonadota bacterium]
MTSRDRVVAAMNHQETDRVPVDLGASPVTGMQVSIVTKLRKALGLDGGPVKVVEPYQLLGEIGEDLRAALGIDVVGLCPRLNLFGFENKDWKEWRLFDGTEVLVPGAFNTEPEPDGEILMYPGGDKTAPPSGRMPKGGYYFDTIIRQPPIDEENLKVEDNLEEFQPISDEDLAYFSREAERLHTTNDAAILAVFGGTAFGDIALVPAPFLKNPKGIRDVEEWYISTHSRKEHIRELYERQCEVALGNLKKLWGAVGDKVHIAYMTGTDFGTQRGPFISPGAYCDLYKPFHKTLNDWIHENTTWKTFIHSCGSVDALIPDFIDAGFDILNPVQCSAACMSADHLKAEYGDRLTFWGGGVDTQKTLPFGTQEEVRAEVSERLRVFSKGGGYIFNTIHNVQQRTPVENVLAMYETVRDCAV